MPWCEKCGKTGLAPAEVDFDDTNKKVLCRLCFSEFHGFPRDPDPPPEVIPEPLALELLPGYPLTYGLHVTSRDGVKAEVKFGELQLAFHAPPQELRKLFGK